jgi:hypothetical protein
MPMKNIYTIIFTANNTNKDENYVLDFSEINKNELIIKKALDHLVFSPRQKVLDNIFKFAREGKI